MRKALKALSMPISRVASAIEAKDTKLLQSLPGVGKRLADQMVAELAGKMDELAVLFGYVDAAEFLGEEGWDSEADGVEPWQREAAYALVFVSNDGSLGVHNPDYALDLLDYAIDHYEDNMGFAAR